MCDSKNIEVIFNDPVNTIEIMSKKSAKAQGLVLKSNNIIIIYVYYIKIQ